MPRTRIPEDVLSAAHQRSAARAGQDWAEADRLRTVIEAAGWRVVDRGTDFALSPAAPPDVEEGERVRYGASRNVPSRLDAPATGLATVVLIAADWPDDVARAVAGLRAGSPTGVSIVVVANEPPDDLAFASLETGDDLEIVWTSERLGHATALNMGIRRATGAVVIVLDPSIEPVGDIVTPLVTALDDPTVAVAGGWGIASDDLRSFEDAPVGDVDAIEGYAQAFRRADFAVRGPLDEHFKFYRNLDIWWSLVLRDAPDDAPDDGPAVAPRRAVRVDLPATRHEHRGWSSLPELERDRQSKRNFYRIIDRFGSRQDLLTRHG